MEVSSEPIIDLDINNLNFKGIWEDTKDTLQLKDNNIDLLRDINNSQLKDIKVKGNITSNLISKEEFMGNNISLIKLKLNNHNKIMMMILISRLFKVLLFNQRIYPNSEKHDFDEYSIS